MTEDQKKWVIAKGRMMDAMKVLGFPEALGDELLALIHEYHEMNNPRILQGLRR
jgi:hypothetical protein